MRQHLARVRFLLELKAEALDTLTRDYAFWDELRDSMQAPTPAFLEASFPVSSLRLSALDLVALYDIHGRPVFSRVLPVSSAGSVGPAPPATLLEVGPQGPPGSPGHDDRNTFFSLEGGLMMISAYPVMATGGVGEPAGTLVFGRRHGELARVCSPT